MLVKNRLLEKFRAQQQVCGVWLQSRDAAYAEMAAIAGLDFVIIDHEHGPGSLQDAAEMLRSLQGTGTTGLVRVPSLDGSYLKRVLDIGAEGVLLPMVEDADAARAAVAACYYPPRGIRGNASAAIRASGYGMQADYVHQAADELLVMAQLESRQALSNAAAIAGVDGIGGVFIGPVDLSGDLGRPGETDTPEINGLVEECLVNMRALGKPIGTTPRASHTWQKILEQGFSMVTVGGDLFFFRQGVLAAVTERKKLAGTPPISGSVAPSATSGY